MKDVRFVSAGKNVKFVRVKDVLYAITLASVLGAKEKEGSLFTAFRKDKMKQKIKIYDERGLCIRCEGTNKCFNCKGTGRVVAKSEPFKGKKVPCPVCYGGGDCKLCHGIERRGW